MAIDLKKLRKIIAEKDDTVSISNRSFDYAKPKNDISKYLKTSAKKTIVTPSTKTVAPEKKSILSTINKGISKVGETIGGFATEFVTAPQKAGVQLGLYATGKESYKPTTGIGKAMLGSEVKDVQKTGIEYLKSFGFGEDKATKYGLGTGLVFAGLDLMPMTSGKGKLGKNAVKLFAKEKDTVKISKVLKDAGISDDLIKPYASKIAKTTDTKTIEKSIKELNRLNDVAKKEIKTISKAEEPLIKEAKKYKTTVNIQDKNDLDYLKRIFSDDTIADIKAGKKTNWRGENYSDVAKVNIISETPKTIEQQLSGKIKNVKLKSNMFYHGTSAENSKGIMSSGFKTGAELPENNFRGGGYGKIQNSISFAETPKEASIFSELTRDGKIVEAKLKPNSKVVSIQGVEDATDLEDYITYLRKQKIDAVYIGGGEKELVIINPKAVSPTDIWNEANKKSVKPITKPQKALGEVKPTKLIDDTVDTKKALRGQDIIDTKTYEKYATGKQQVKELSAKNIEKAIQETTPKPSLAKSQETFLKTSYMDDNVIDDILKGEKTDVKKKVNALDYIRTPDRVLNKIGLGNEAKLVRKQYDKYLAELPTNIEKITEWTKQVPKESNAKIFQYLDGEEVVLTAKEKQVAGEIKTWLSEWADRLGLPEDKRISNYVTHLFDEQLVKKEFDEDLAKIIADKIPKSVYDPFLQKRLGKLGYKQDTWAALDAYVKRGTRKVHMDEALEQMSKKAGVLEDSQWKYVKSYVDNINMRPKDIDNSLDNLIKSSPIEYRLGQRPTTRILGSLRKMTYRGMLGLNPGSALRNISQGINTYAVLGEKYTAVGYSKLFSPSARKEILESGILDNSFIQDRTLSSTKAILQKFDKGLFIFFETAEKINRGSAYLGAKAKGLKMGMSEAKAVDYAKEVVRKTQFKFDSIDTPVILQSDIAKTLGQFQSFTTKQIEFLGEMLKEKEFVGLMRYAFAGTAFVYTIGKAFGMEEKELIPNYRIGTPPSLKLPYEIGKAIMNAPDKYGNIRDVNKKLEDITKASVGLIPAGTQAKKSYEGYKAVKEGAKTTKAGTKQFDVGGTPIKNAQAILFGQYSGEGAKDYFSGKSYTQQKYEEIKNSPTAKEDFAKIMKEEPALASRIKELKRQEDAGFTDEDKEMINMAVRNGERAEYIVDKINKLKTKEEKRDYYQELINKKIVTKEITNQVKELLK
jgi:hypothetical protein